MLKTLTNTKVTNTTTTINTLITTLINALPESTPMTTHEVTVQTNTLNENVIGVTFKGNRVKSQLESLNAKPTLLKQDICLLTNIVDYILDEVDNTVAVIGSLSDVDNSMTYFDGFKTSSAFVKASLATPNNFINVVIGDNITYMPDGYTLKRNGMDTFVGFISTDENDFGLFRDVDDNEYTRSLKAIAGELHQYRLVSDGYYGYKLLIDFISKFMNSKQFEHENESFSREVREYAKSLKNILKHVKFSEVEETATSKFLQDVYDHRVLLDIDDFYKYPPTFRALCDIYGLTIFKQAVVEDITLDEAMVSKTKAEPVIDVTEETVIPVYDNPVEVEEVTEVQGNKFINPLEPKGLVLYDTAKDMDKQSIFKYQHGGNVVNDKTIKEYGNNLIKSFKHADITERYKAGIVIGTYRAILLADNQSMINYVNGKAPVRVEEYVEVIQKTLFDLHVYTENGSMRDTKQDEVYNGLDKIFYERMLSIPYITNLMSYAFYSVFNGVQPKFTGEFEIHYMTEPKQETTKPKQTVVKRVEQTDVSDVDKLVEVIQIKDNQIDEALQGLVYRDTQIDKLLDSLSKRDAEIEKLLTAVENRDEKLEVVTNTLESFQETLENVIGTVSAIAKSNIKREESFAESINSVGDKLNGMNNQRFIKQEKLINTVADRVEDNTLALVEIYEVLTNINPDTDPDKQPKPENEQEEILNDIKDIVNEASQDTFDTSVGIGLGLGLNTANSVRVVNPLTNAEPVLDNGPTVLEARIQNDIKDKPLFDKLKITGNLLSENNISMDNLSTAMSENVLLSPNFAENIGIPLELIHDILGIENPTDERIQDIVDEQEDDTPKPEIAQQPEFESKFDSVFMTAMEDIATKETTEQVLDDEQLNPLIENAEYYKANEAENGTFYLGITPIEFAIRKFNLLPVDVQEEIHAKYASEKLKDSEDWDDSEDDMVEADDETLREAVLKEFPEVFNIGEDGLSEDIVDVITARDVQTMLKGKTNLYLKKIENKTEDEYGIEMIVEVYKTLTEYIPHSIEMVSDDNLVTILNTLVNNPEVSTYVLYQHIDNKNVLTPEMLYVHVMLLNEAISVIANGIYTFSADVKTSIAVNNRVIQSDTEVVFDGKPRMPSYNFSSVYGLSKENVKIDTSLGFGKPNFIGDSIKSIEFNQLALLAETACLYDHQTCGELAENFANMLVNKPSSITAPHKLAKKIKELADKNIYTDNHFGIYAVKPTNDTLVNQHHTVETLKIKQAFQNIGVNILPRQINVLIKGIGYNLLSLELAELNAYLDYTLLSMMFARYAYYSYKANIDYTCFTNVNEIDRVIGKHKLRPETNRPIATLYVATKVMFLLQEFLLNKESDPSIVSVDGVDDLKEYVTYKGLIGETSRPICGDSKDNNNTPRLIPVQCNELLKTPFIIDTVNYQRAITTTASLREVVIANACTVDEAIEFITNAYGLRDGHGDIVERIINRKLLTLPIEQQQHMKYVFLSEILSSVVIPQSGHIRGSVAMTLETMYTKDTTDILDLAKSTNMSKCGTVTVSNKALTHNLISSDEHVLANKILNAKHLVVSAGKALVLLNKISKDVLKLDISEYETVDTILQKDLL